MSSGSRKAMMIVAAVLYVASFFLPTAAPFKADLSEIRITGWEAFRGCLRMLLNFEPREPDAWIFGAAWLVNPLFWLAGVASLYERRRVAGVLSWIAVLLCLPVLLRFGEIIVGHPGYWCWLGSVVLLTFVNSQWVPTTKDIHTGVRELSPLTKK